MIPVGNHGMPAGMAVAMEIRGRFGGGACEHRQGKGGGDQAFHGIYPFILSRASSARPAMALHRREGE
jgi:hypothetical protein